MFCFLVGMSTFPMRSFQLCHLYFFIYFFFLRGVWSCVFQLIPDHASHLPCSLMGLITPLLTPYCSLVSLFSASGSAGRKKVETGNSWWSRSSKYPAEMVTRLEAVIPCDKQKWGIPSGGAAPFQEVLGGFWLVLDRPPSAGTTCWLWFKRKDHQTNS